MRKAIVIAAGLALAFAGPAAGAELARFQFSAFFATGSAGAITLSGTFSGEFENGRITRMTDIRLFRDGQAFRGNGALFTAQFDKRTRRWEQGGYLSLDGGDNNVIFIDTDYAAGDAGFLNYFYSVTGIGNAAFQPSFYRYRAPDTRTLTITRVAMANGVPEPASWALLIIGFGAIGAALRGRRRLAPGLTAPLSSPT